jgi:hypothetical protein
MRAPSEPFQETLATRQVPSSYNFRVLEFRLEGDTSMHLFGAFELDIQPGTPDNPASLRVRLFITPECATFEEVEGQLNSLQDELDEIRERARRAFQVA